MKISNLKINEKTLKKFKKEQMTCKISGTIGILAPIISYSTYITSPSDVTLTACTLSNFGVLIAALSYQKYKETQKEKENYEKAIRVLEINGLQKNDIVQNEEWHPTGDFKEFEVGTHMIKTDGENKEGYIPYPKLDTFLINEVPVVALEYKNDELEMSTYPFSGVPLEKSKTMIKK